ncbi:MAG: hypothetical protein ABIG95_05635 [Candidatus Woesearchaeota archaeon]
MRPVKKVFIAQDLALVKRLARFGNVSDAELRAEIELGRQLTGYFRSQKYAADYLQEGEDPTISKLWHRVRDADLVVVSCNHPSFLCGMVVGIADGMYSFNRTELINHGYVGAALTKHPDPRGQKDLVNLIASECYSAHDKTAHVPHHFTDPKVHKNVTPRHVLITDISALAPPAYHPDPGNEPEGYNPELVQRVNTIIVGGSFGTGIELIGCVKYGVASVVLLLADYSAPQAVLSMKAIPGIILREGYDRLDGLVKLVETVPTMFDTYITGLRPKTVDELGIGIPVLLVYTQGTLVSRMIRGSPYANEIRPEVQYQKLDSLPEQIESLMPNTRGNAGFLV